MLSKKPLRGMRDFLPKEVQLREFVKNSIKEVYKSFGFVQIETPSIEDIKTLTSKQGGDNEKLIFKILKRGEKLAKSEEGDLCDMALRYDLTVPLSRYFANNSGSLPSVFKSIQMGNVWRAENSQKGRFRQFVQCDIDIIGEAGSMAEIELIDATSTVLRKLSLQNFTIRLNDRRILKAIAKKCNFDESQFEKVFVCLDKLDKIGKDGVQKELVELGFLQNNVEQLNTIVDCISKDGLKTARGLLKGFADESVFDDMENILYTCEKFCNIVFDCTLVRGMNYYTGAIFEVAVDGLGISVAGGGRYDEMLGKFLPTSQPACGFSIGFERILTLIDPDKLDLPKVSKIAYVVDGDAGREVFESVFAKANIKRQQGSVCLVTKRIKNFRFLLDQLKEQGYTSVVQVNSKGESNTVDL